MFESSNIIILLLVILIIIYFIKKHYEVKNLESFYDNITNSNIYDPLDCNAKEIVITTLTDIQKPNSKDSPKPKCTIKELIKKTEQKKQQQKKEERQKKQQQKQKDNTKSNNLHSFLTKLRNLL